MALVVDTDKSTAKRNLTLQLPLALQNLVNFIQLIVCLAHYHCGSLLMVLLCCFWLTASINNLVILAGRGELCS